jgi:ABC-type branched-subunit amino acid transport system substrate-binding protein
MRPNLYSWLIVVGLFSGASGGCNAILGLSELSLRSEAADASVDSGKPPAGQHVGACTTNRECTDRASGATKDAAANGAIPAICVKPEQRCVELLSEDCTAITGDYLNDRAIVLGSLFSTNGSQSATNLPRQQSAMLAVEEIDAAGGVPAGNTSADARPLVMVSCDESVDLQRAGRHLVTDLKIAAIIGPNTSQDTLDLSNELSIPARTLVISPTAVASSISDLRDDDLTWLMVPSDEQRAPLMINQISELEHELRRERNREQLKLGVIFRNDALGIGTRVSLNGLVFNDKPLADPSNLGDHVRIDPYDFKDANQTALVDAYVDFAPDIVVLVGTAESVTQVMVPVEQRWTGDDSSRPYYVTIDSTKVPELIAAVTGNDALRRRIRGTGITPGPSSAPIYNAFKVDYQLRFPDSPATISGMGPSYDATYAIAYALAATKDMPTSGPSIANGLRKLTGGPVIEIGTTKILAAFQKLAAGENISVLGSFGPLQWDENGAVVGGTIEIWCIGGSVDKPVYQSSGLTFDVATQQLQGLYVQCGP